MHRPPRIALLAAALALACTVAASSGQSAPSGWSRVSGPAGAGPQLGIARAGGTLHVIWNRGPTSTSIFDTRFSPTGTQLGTSTVATGWDGNGGLALLAMPDGTLRLFAAGGHTPGLASALEGINTLTAPATAASWTLAPDVVWGGAVASAAGHVGATLTKDGTPVTTWDGYVHTGLDPSAPSPFYQPDMTDSAVATDGASGAVVLSGVTIAGKGGTFVKQVLPSPGPTVMLPSTLQDRASGASARIGAPGVFVAYTDGKTVRLYRYGGATKTIASGPFNMASVFAGPAGRLWLVWADSNNAFFVTRSNRSVSGFEPVQKLALPPNTTGVYTMQAEGSAGPLDLFADMLLGSNDRGFRHVHVLARFGIRALETRTKTTTKVTIAARDAGDPVPGAAVTVSGRHLRTDAKGQVHLTLRPGTYTASASAPGYAPASTRFTVR